MVEGGGASVAAGGAGPLKADSGQKNSARGPIQATSLQRDTHHAPGRHEGHRQVPTHSAQAEKVGCGSYTLIEVLR